MVKEAKLKCLRCGHEYAMPPSESTELEERTCPRCGSNSVRKRPEEKKGND